MKILIQTKYKRFAHEFTNSIDCSNRTYCRFILDVLMDYTLRYFFNSKEFTTISLHQSTLMLSKKHYFANYVDCLSLSIGPISVNFDRGFDEQDGYKILNYFKNRFPKDKMIYLPILRTKEIVYSDEVNTRL